MRVDQIPNINGQKVGIENGQTGTYAPENIAAAYRLSRDARSFFVLDPGRIMYATDQFPPRVIEKFILGYIERMKPRNDIIHMADKTSWSKRFREASCALGADNGIGVFMIEALRDFDRRGGLIVFEHEDLQMALESLKVFE
jgi:hypothetical protein